MITAARVVVWITTVLGGLGTLAGLVLAYLCIRWGHGTSDRLWGAALAAFALGQNAIAYAGFRLAAGGSPGWALALGLFWAFVSVVFLAGWPTLVSALGQP